jgi:hypothetical protein
MQPPKEKLKVLITVKTYPIPSAKYDELVCTAGVRESGDFVRLYPINFRNLSFDQQYKKYQWIEVEATKHVGRDVRKESYRPNCDTLRVLGKPIPPKRGDWSERARYALAKRSQSLEELYELQAQDNTSLGVFRPKTVKDLVISADETEWPAKFTAALKQSRLFETRGRTLVPPRKVPFKFHYEFECDDPRCNGHRMMIEDWEVGALYWNLINRGCSPDEATAKVKQKFLDEICGASKDTHFYVGTILAHPKSWVIIGVFWPKRDP